MAREITRSSEKDVTARPAGDQFREMVGLRDTINGMFEDFFSGRPLLGAAAWEPSGYQEAGWTPPVDICDAGDELVAYVGLIGVKKEDCQVEVKDSTLVISGECKEPAGEGKEFLRHELACGRFYRAFGLPTDVKADQVKASYHDGLLEIHLPKAESAKSRRVEIQ